MSELNETMMWVVVDKDKNTQNHSLAQGRNKAVKEYLGQKHSKLEWHRCYNNGYRVQKVEVVIL